MINIFIDYQETVVSCGVFMQCNSRILLIVFLNILTQLLRYMSVVNVNRHPRLTFGKLNQHRIIYIIVNQNNPFLCLTDKIRNQGVGIKNLAVEKDSLLRFLIITKLIKNCIDFLISFQLLLLNTFNSLKN